MVAEISMSQLYWNTKVLNFFFRTQAEETLMEVLNLAKDKKTALDDIEDFFDNIDDCEETFYNDSAEEIIEMIGIETC